MCTYCPWQLRGTTPDLTGAAHPFLSCPCPGLVCFCCVRCVSPRRLSATQQLAMPSRGFPTAGRFMLAICCSLAARQSCGPGLTRTGLRHANEWSVSLTDLTSLTLSQRTLTRRLNCHVGTRTCVRACVCVCVCHSCIQILYVLDLNGVGCVLATVWFLSLSLSCGVCMTMSVASRWR